MYKNIIFDLGGVVVDFNPREFLLERFYNEEIEQKVFELTIKSEIKEGTASYKSSNKQS